MPEATVRLPISGLGGTDYRVGERVIVEREKESETFTVKRPSGYGVMVGVPAKYLTLDAAE